MTTITANLDAARTDLLQVLHKPLLNKDALRKLLAQAAAPKPVKRKSGNFLVRTTMYVLKQIAITMASILVAVVFVLIYGFFTTFVLGR